MEYIINYKNDYQKPLNRKLDAWGSSKSSLDESAILIMTGVLPTAVSGNTENTPFEPKISSKVKENSAFSPTSPSDTTRSRPGSGVPLAKQKSFF